MSENTMLGLSQMGVSTERAAATCRELARTIGQIAVSITNAVDGFRRLVKQAAAQQEMKTALSWASIGNRPLYNRYHRTKKKRIRKKYAKRILAWYREEVLEK